VTDVPAVVWVTATPQTFHRFDRAKTESRWIQILGQFMIAPFFFPMTEQKLIIFDLDGTLVDSLDDLTASVNHMLAACGRPSVCRESVRGMVGQGAVTLVSKAMPGADAGVLQRGLEIFLAHNEQHLADRTVPFEGVIATLTTLSRTGHVMVVVTNKNESLSRTLLAKLNLDRFFHGIYGADSLPARKPSPLPLLHVMSVHGFTAGATLMVGDSINDIAAGTGAGVITVGCSWGYGDDTELSGALWRIDTFVDLLSLPPLADRPA
jgi:phosphoglycolate phosphatase